jgi:cation diffusion facilitator family transporter
MGHGHGAASDSDAHDADDAHDHAHAHGGGLLARLRSVLTPHSHDVADQIDDALATSALGIRTTKLTLVVLLVTAAAQLAVALVSGSVALLADMVHNVADAMTSIPLWIAFALGRRARTRRYPYGYRRAEDLAGVFILLMIAASAVLIGWESFQRLLDPTPMQHAGWVLAAGIIGVIGNEVAAIVRIRVGRRIGSAALVADGYHARADTFASFAVIVAVIGTWRGLPILDPLVGLLITAMIVWILKTTAVQVVHRLMDGVEPEVLTRIESSAAQVGGVEAVGTVRARWSGHRLLADLTISVTNERTLAEAHDIGEEVRHRLLHDVAHLDDAWVHVNPTADGDADPHHLTAHHRPDHDRTQAPPQQPDSTG